MRGGFDERRGWLEDLSDGDDRVREGVVGGVVGEGVVGEGVIGEGVVRVGVVGEGVVGGVSGVVGQRVVV